MSENNLVSKEITRDEIVENITSAYFFEKNIIDLSNDYEQLEHHKPLPPKQPQAPSRPTEPVKTAPETIDPIKYPEIETPEIPSPKLWKKGLFLVGTAWLVMAFSGWFTDGLMVPALGLIGFFAAIIYTFRLAIKNNQYIKAKRVEYIEQVKKSEAYKQKCYQIDEENQRRQLDENKRADMQYADNVAEYERQCKNYEEAMLQHEEKLKLYDEECEHYKSVIIPEWENEKKELRNLIESAKNTLTEIYNQNILPVQYRGVGTTAYFAAFLGTSQFDLKFAIERYDSMISQKYQSEQLNVANQQLNTMRLQTGLLREVLANQEYAHYLNEQVIELTEHGNKTMKSAHNWQRFDILLDEYRLHKRKKAARR